MLLRLLPVGLQGPISMGHGARSVVVCLLRLTPVTKGRKQTGPQGVDCIEGPARTQVP